MASAKAAKVSMIKFNQSSCTGVSGLSFDASKAAPMKVINTPTILTVTCRDPHADIHLFFTQNEKLWFVDWAFSISFFRPQGMFARRATFVLSILSLAPGLSSPWEVPQVDRTRPQGILHKPI